jgi:hypothetical protein
MKSLFSFLVTCAALVALGPASAANPRAAAPAPYAGQCGLPVTQPLWMDFGQPAFQAIFGKPGVVVGASTGDWPAQMRALGVGTVYFDLNLRNRVGTPTKPTDSATMADRAQRLYTFASQQSGCECASSWQRAPARARHAVV